MHEIIPTNNKKTEIQRVEDPCFRSVDTMPNLI